MVRKPFLWAISLSLACGLACFGGTFGKVVAIGGAASDLALDEARGYLYVANFTANRIERVSLATNTVQSSINVPAQPSSLALSPDGRYLVVTHYSNFATGSSANGLTVVDLTTNGKQTFALGNPPLGAAFTIDGLALVVTTSEFIQFDPVTGTTNLLSTISALAAKTLPQPPATFPPTIVAASMAASGDGAVVYGLTDTIMFRYGISGMYNSMAGLKIVSYVSTPPQGPRVVSVNRDGTYYTAGWALNDKNGRLVAEFLNPSGLLNVGSHAFDSSRNLVYAQIPESAAAAPILQIVDSDNLTVREKLQLPENLAGKSVLSSDSNTMYSISDSGVLVLPVGNLGSVGRLAASAEDLVFRGNFCDRRVASQTLTITDPGGGHTAFTLASDTTGVTVNPSTGVTPAVVTVSVDPTAFQNTKGTVAAKITMTSTQAANIPASVRVLVNMHEPDQRGIFVDVPGTLVDLLADPARNRFYVLRQDKNQVLVFDSTNNSLIATLRTGNTPTQLAITFDRQYLLVGSNDSQIIPVFDLDTLEAKAPIVMPGGHYPRSIAASAKALLVANRVAGPLHVIDRVDFATRTATELPTLGVFNNDVDANTNLVASPNGSTIFAVEANGTVLLYDANVDTFTVSRKDVSGLSGPYAASSFSQYVVGNLVLNSSLVSTSKLETATGTSSGFAFVDNVGLRLTTPGATSPGIVQRVDVGSGVGSHATRMIESPLTGNSTYAFTRTIAPLWDRSAIIALTVSGFTVLPWSFDASVAPPVISQVVNAANFSTALAPGGLITIFGSQLSPTNIATSEIPLPTALGDSCLTVNGLAVPVMFVSPQQINAQLPFQATGNVTLILRTPGGVSDNYNLTILPNAPSVFSAFISADTAVPTIVRFSNSLLVTPSNPVHRGDVLTIYLTGMGQTTPSVTTGSAAPADPLARPLVQPTVTLGSTSLPVAFAGLTPGQVGLYQINVNVPKNAPTGLNVPLLITQGSGSTTVNVRVVE